MKLTNPLLIDGDIIAYKASSSVQKDIDWGDGLFTCHAYLDDAIDQFKVILDGILEGIYENILYKYSTADMLFFFSDKDNFRKHYLPDYKSNRKNTRKPTCYNALVEWILYKYSTADMLFFFSDKDNFRKHYLPDYKSNRKNTRKPTCYNALVEWIYNTYKCVKPIKYLEADDLIGIYATSYENPIIISMDKDFKTIPAKFFDFGRGEFKVISKDEADYWHMYQTLVGDATAIIISMDKDFKTIPAKFFDFGRGEFKVISKDEADYWHMYQTLVGDATDGYKGCPSYGPVKAKKLLLSVPSDNYWGAVVNAYNEQGLTKDDAILQATMARILRKDDFHRFTEGDLPPLWSPPPQ